ncbi:hypothetical protein PR048_023681 [Dryococelus australis]|uniref:Uncharacterized protein n=1 Tax=Dryococelus australis TaxID=614101 RepID=A0ABQ9GUT7_9NEOP|nr:hypothetical protein PR048_023681 [Dryococelus australis]
MNILSFLSAVHRSKRAAPAKNLM